MDTSQASRGVSAIVDVLRRVETGKVSRSVVGGGHYASVLRLDESLGLALATDGVGSKLIVAEQLGRFDTVGIDCVAMNANDIICVGAEPIALLDYIAVEEVDPEMLAELATGLRAGAEQAGVEIPGGELAVVPELLRGHPSPHGFDLVGSCVGTVQLDAIVTGAAVEPGDALIGIPSSGVHSNGFTLARRALPDLEETPAELGGASVGDALLEPTVMYVRAVLELLASPVDVRGLAHITGDGLLNLLRLEAPVGYRVDSPLPSGALFDLLAERSGADDGELYEVFNMGCGFCCVVPAEQADEAVSLLARRHPGTAVIGRATTAQGVVELPFANLMGRKGDGFRAAA